MNFRSRIESVNVSIYGLDTKLEKLFGLQSGSDYDIEPNTFVVSWEFDVETREWGVKNLSWYATDINGDFDIVYFDKNGDEKERENVKFVAGDFREHLDMEVDLEHGSISFNDIDIDYKAMTVTVS